MAPGDQAQHSQRMSQRFISIRSKLLFLLCCFLFGLISIISVDFYFDKVRQNMDTQYKELLVQSDHVDRILQLVNTMQSNLYKVIYQDNVVLQSRILADNEDLLFEFEELTTVSQQAELDEDYFFLRENETALLNLRANIFRAVALIRIGEQKQSIQLLTQNIEPGVSHIKTYVENTSEIRRLKVLDYFKLKKDLSNRHRLLEVIITFVFFSVGIVIAIYVARSIVGPIESLIKQIQVLKHGDTNPTSILTSVSNDEAAILTDAFNELLMTRESAMKSAQEQEQLASNLLNSTGEAIYGIDLNGECTFANKRCLEMLGNQSEQELLGKNMHVVIHHTHNDGTPYPIEECKIFQAFREGEGSHVDDEVLWRADGSSFDSEYRSIPIRRHGEIIGSVVSFTDITERKKLEQERIRVAAELTQLIDTANAPIFGGDNQGRINEWNQTTAK